MEVSFFISYFLISNVARKNNNKVIAFLAEQSKTTGYNPINQNHLEWLELQRQQNSRDQFREEAWLEHQRNQLRYTMLLKEAEEAERLAGEI